jgi:hypothetical protein
VHRDLLATVSATANHVSCHDGRSSVIRLLLVDLSLRLI